MIGPSTVEAGYPTKALGEVVEFLDHLRRPITEADRKPGPTPYYGANGQQDSVEGWLFDEPLVLLAEDGGHFDDPTRGIAYRIEGRSWVNNHAHVLRTTPLVDDRWLVRVLENYDVTSFITGSTRAKLTKAGASRIPIPVPPIEEQRRIAAVLDAADALRAKRRQALAKLDTLTQAIFIDMFGDARTWPGDRHSVSLGQLEAQGKLQIGRGKVISRKDIEACPGDFPIYSSAGQNGGEFGRYGRYMFDEEMITWSVDGGGHLFYRPRHRFSVTNVGGWIRVLDVESLSARYLHAALALLHSRLTFDWTQKAHSSVIKRVYSDLLVPPLSDQQRYAELVERADESRRTVIGHSESLDTLFASLQQRAFRGEL